MMPVKSPALKAFEMVVNNVRWVGIACCTVDKPYLPTSKRDEEHRSVL